MSLLWPEDRMYPTSLVPKFSHNQHLLYLMAHPVSYEMVDYIARVASSVIGEDKITALPTPPISPNKQHGSYRCPNYADLTRGFPDMDRFIVHIVQKSNVQTPTLLCATIYLQRLRSKLPPYASGTPGTRHRTFLAALIVSAKYLNDTSPKNSHWAAYARLFDMKEVNLMEKQLLFLLNYDLRITEGDALHHFQPFIQQLQVRMQDQQIARMKLRDERDARAVHDQELREASMRRLLRGSAERLERARAEAEGFRRQQQEPTHPPGIRISSAAAPTYTNTHMQSSRALANALSRGPSTESLSSDFSDGLTDDNGTSSSSSDSEESWSDVHQGYLREREQEDRQVYVHPSLLPKKLYGAIGESYDEQHTRQPAHVYAATVIRRASSSNDDEYDEYETDYTYPDERQEYDTSYDADSDYMDHHHRRSSTYASSNTTLRVPSYVLPPTAVKMTRPSLATNTNTSSTLPSKISRTFSSMGVPISAAPSAGPSATTSRFGGGFSLKSLWGGGSAGRGSARG